MAIRCSARRKRSKGTLRDVAQPERCCVINSVPSGPVSRVPPSPLRLRRSVLWAHAFSVGTLRRPLATLGAAAQGRLFRERGRRAFCLGWYLETGDCRRCHVAGAVQVANADDDHGRPLGGGGVEAPAN